MVGLVPEGVLVSQFLVVLAVEGQTFSLVFLYLLAFLQNISQNFVIDLMRYQFHIFSTHDLNPLLLPVFESGVLQFESFAAGNLSLPQFLFIVKNIEF